jgi:chloride channel 3/4/5
MALGKEGPLVHVACCIGNIIPRFFIKYARNEAKKREMLSAASAAGVSVAFGAPIGGVLFSLEEVSYYFPYKTMWRSFFCAMIAALCLRLVNPFRTGKLVLFQVDFKRNWHGFELPFFVLLGILGGLYGSLFIKMNLRFSAYRRDSWLSKSPLLEIATVSLLTGLVSFPFQFLRANASELVANLFRECLEVENDFYGLCR